MTLAEIIAQLRAKPSQDVPFTGMVLADTKKGAAYTAAKNGTLGVPVFWSGGKLRTASIDIARRLGIEDAVTAPAKTDQQAQATPPMETSAPVTPLAAPKSAPTKSRKAAPKAMSARKAPARKAAAPHQSKSLEAVG